MDMVAIGSPSGLHAEQAIAAVQRGLHVLVEKPLDTTTAKIDALIAEADRARAKVGVFFQERFMPEIAAIKAAHRRMARSARRSSFPAACRGTVRPSTTARSRWRGTRALDGGGALMNQGIHTVDLLLWLFGPVAGVLGRTANRLHQIEVEDTAVATARVRERRARHGRSDDRRRPGIPAPARGGRDRRAPSFTRTPPRPAAVADATPHRRVLEDFIRAIRTGTDPACDAREGRRSVALVDAIYRSARSGRMEKP